MQKATTARENTDNSQIQERINLAYHSSLVDGQGKVTEASLESELKKEFNKTSLDEGWLDKTSIEGKWKITIDDVSLEVPAGIETLIQPSSPLDILIGRKKKDIMFNSSISIDDNTSAKFYDCDFNTCDDYVEYNEKIYKVSYNIDYDSLDESAKQILSNRDVDTTGKTPGELLNFFQYCNYPFKDFRVNIISLTDIEMISLGKNGNNITTIVYGTKNFQYTDTVNGVESNLFSADVGGYNHYFAYSSSGILSGYPHISGESDWIDYGWTPWFY